MNDADFARALAKMWGQDNFNPGNTKPFAGVRVTPGAVRAIGRAGSHVSATRTRANPVLQSMLVRQATTAVNQGKFSSGKAIGRLNTSVARPAPAAQTPASTAMGSSSGSSGSYSTQLGVAPTTGSYSASAPVAAPSAPRPLNG